MDENVTPEVTPEVTPSILALPVAETETKVDEPTAKAEEKTPDKVIPDEYTFQVPEGMEADATVLASYEPVFKKLGLTNEAAQELVDVYTASKKADMDAHVAAMAAQTQTWYSAVKADPELGGAKFEASVKAGQKVMAKYGTPELSEYLYQTGLGNHPELVRLVARIGSAMAEDVIHTGKTSEGQTDLRTFYPNSNMN